jgi:hypothetical protein
MAWRLRLGLGWQAHTKLGDEGMNSVYFEFLLFASDCKRLIDTETTDSDLLQSTGLYNSDLLQCYAREFFCSGEDPDPREARGQNNSTAAVSWF